MKFIIVAIASFVYWQWISLYLFITSVNGTKNVIKKIQDKTLLDLVFKKTGLKLKSIRISSSNKLWGIMIGLPKNPYLILSRALYEDFNKDEIEYVVLHEIGHYLLAHSAKLALTYIFLLVIGFFAIFHSNSFVLWLIVALIIGVLEIQISRIFEHQADNFALKRITDPKGMITATHKFKKHSTFYKLVKLDEDTILGRLIYISIPYNQRIRNAKREIEQRRANRHSK